jgi:rod shape-determining protein MreC
VYSKLYLPDFFWKNRRVIILAALLGFSCLIIIDTLHRGNVSRISSEILHGVSVPAQKATESANDGGRRVLSIIPDFFRARVENKALRRRVGELEQEVVSLREQLLREHRLQQLGQFAGPLGGRKIVARVVGTDPTAWFNTVIVDKGATDNVRRYLPAVSSSGLAGCVIEVYRYSSKILLLTDSNSKVSIVVQRSRARGVAQGDDAGGCMLKYVESTADIIEGDVVVTSGNSYLYPNGLLVGYVDELKKEPGSLFQWAHMTPATDFKKLEEVAIIITPERLREDVPEEIGGFR